MNIHHLLYRIEKKKPFLFVMKILQIYYSYQLSHIAHSSVDYAYHIVHFIPSIDLSHI